MKGVIDFHLIVWYLNNALNITRNDDTWRVQVKFGGWIPCNPFIFMKTAELKVKVSSKTRCKYGMHINYLCKVFKKNLYWCKIVVIFLQNVIKLTTIRLCRRMSNEIWHSAGFWEELHVVGWSYEMFTNFGRFFVCFFDVTYWLPWRSQRRQLAKLWEMALY